LGNQLAFKRIDLVAIRPAGTAHQVCIPDPLSYREKEAKQKLSLMSEAIDAARSRSERSAEAHRSRCSSIN
jgi:hypothetical protein